MLFKDVEKVGDENGLKEYLGGIQKTMVWKTWKPFVEGAELTYLIPAIGQEQFDELDSDQLSAKKKALKERLRMALAWYAYVDAMPSLITVTGDGGMVVSSVPNTQAVPKWLYVETKKSHQDKADRYLESALALLEVNADDFPIWKASAFYTIQLNQLIQSATQATRFLPAIQNSRRMYLAIRGYFNLAEEDYILPILGGDFYRWLLENQATIQIGTKEAEALKLARKALVHYAVYLAIPWMNMNQDFRLVSETDGIVNENALGGERLNQLRADTIGKAHQAGAELRNYLNAQASAEVFPLYFSSAQYVAPTGAYQRSITNDSSKPYAVL